MGRLMHRNTPEIPTLIFNRENGTKTLWFAVNSPIYTVYTIYIHIIDIIYSSTTHVGANPKLISNDSSFETSTVITYIKSGPVFSI